jgi:glutamyl-tRNA synthetase
VSVSPAGNRPAGERAETDRTLIDSSGRVRVRFAPSPTGYLHVGGARTALFNWLFARHEAGVFVLRIEDTDRTRSQPELSQAILDGLRWLGLNWDEGPYYQTDGLDRHRRDAQGLLESGAAYRCFCPPERIEAERARAAAAGGGWRYDRRCLALSADAAAGRAAAGERFAIRFRVPAGKTAWQDIVYGDIAFDNDAIEDFVVLRSDGTPVYNMAVVSDDVEHRITHVLRGEDHVSNTPKQILLYRALGRRLPRFAHVPLILGPDGRRLSKRHGATAVAEYRQQGILPEAMVNFLALLGWSPGNDEEILDLETIIARFSLDAIHRKSAVFDPQKLSWMNGQYLSRAEAVRLEPLVLRALEARAPGAHDALAQDRARLHALIDLLKVRSRSTEELADAALPFVQEHVTFDAGAVARHWKDPVRTAELLSALRTTLATAEPWEAAVLEPLVRGLAQRLGIGAGKLIHPFRVALTGAAASPGIFDVVVLLGRDRVLARLDRALEELRSMAQAAPDGPDRHPTRTLSGEG